MADLPEKWELKPENYLDLLPDGAIPQYGFRFVRYLDENGDMLDDWKTDGVANAGEIIGVLESVKLMLWTRHVAEQAPEVFRGDG